MYVSKIMGIITMNQTNLVYPFIHKILRMAANINMIINLSSDVSYCPWNKSIVI